MKSLVTFRRAPALILILATLLVTATSVSAADLCSRFELEEPPSWVTEAVWLPEQDQLVISDWRKNQIITFAADGAVVESIRFRETERPPFAILPFGADFLFVNGAARVDWVDDSLQRKRPVSLNFAEPKLSDWYVGGIWSKQTVIAGQSLVAMGGLVKEGRQFIGAFSVPLPSFAQSSSDEEPRPIFQFQPRAEFKGQTVTSAVPGSLQFSHESTPYYLQSMKYATAIGSNAYILVLADRPVIVKHNTRSGQTRVLRGFPWALTEQLPERAAGTPATRFARLASLDIPAGLYAQGNALYALRRSPARAGGTLWRLTKLVPAGNALRDEGTVVLPTTSEHISLLPTGDGWIVIEEGRVSDRQAQTPQGSRQMLGYKNVRSALIVRNDAIDTPDLSPLAEARFDHRRAYCSSR